MAWIERTKVSTDVSEKRTIGKGIFRRCDACGATLRAEEFSANFEVCPQCGHHYPLSGEGWIKLLCDPGSFRELDMQLVAGDPLGFKDQKKYPDRIKAAQKKTGLKDAISVGSCAIDGRAIQLGVFLFNFMGGSMGSVVGEKITRMLERSAALKQPAVLLSASGGARMQEGILSLMQMAKTVSALARVRRQNVPFISVLLNPTTGGVAASFSFLGDVNIAEPKALIGFAGPRVIENTIRQKLPTGFQSSEFLVEHGMVDIIAHRQNMRATIAQVLDHLVG